PVWRRGADGADARTVAPEPRPGNRHGAGARRSDRLRSCQVARPAPGYAADPGRGMRPGRYCPAPGRRARGRTRPPSGSAAGVLRRDVRFRGAEQQSELVLPHERIVPDVHLEPVRLLHAPQEVGLLLQDVQRDLRVDADRDLVLHAFDGGPADRSLDAPDHRVRGEYPAGPAAVHARLRQRLEERRAHALPGHLHEPELRYLERPGAGPVAVEVRPELLEDPLLVRLRLHVDEVADDDAAHVPEP